MKSVCREHRGQLTKHHGSAQPLTPYGDVNELLDFYPRHLVGILAGNVRGVYLTGSLSYDAFNYDTSDIDIVVIVNGPPIAMELAALRRLHIQITEKFPMWAQRLECSYTPIDMLPNVRPPKEPRPYWGGEGIFYETALYGNEWIINNYLLYRYGMPLYGPDFDRLAGPVKIEEVQKACIRDLFQEWEPKSGDEHWLGNGHYASYFVLNLCRILYTVMCKEAGSKTTAAAWVKRRYGEPWKELISVAEEWRYGMELDVCAPAVAFLHFVIGEVSQTALYGQMVHEISEVRSSRGDQQVKGPTRIALEQQ